MPKGSTAATTAGSTKSTKLVERDVEAPEVFSATDQGLWDGRPSLGGVWVAHPDVSEPERVIIRNEANGKFVIGALFRKERDLPGPKLQISSDAAAALSILAGAPAPLNVTALRREESEVAAPVDDAATGTVDAPAEVSETSLDPIAAAGAAIDASAATPPAPKPEAPRPTSSLSKPFVQLGIFSIEANANRVAKQMRGAGMVPAVKQSEINGKPFWRVLVGPATSKSELNNLIKAIKAEGFSDAYAVTN
nr:SPOR domain-containing protein [Sulfitobacter pacificus]